MVGSFLGGIAGGSVVSIVIRAIDDFSRNFKNANSQLDIIKSHARVAGIALVGMGGAGLAMGISITKAASDVNESINAVNVIFGTASDKILDFSKTSAKATGLAQADFNQMSAQIGALLKDTGASLDDVAGMTTQLAMRSADMASVMNTSVEDAFYAINQAIRGETEAIRRYSGDVTDATLEQFLLAKGINKTVKELTQQEKRLYRVQLIMHQTDKFAGDFKNTSDELANQLRILQADVKDLAAKLGQALLPVAKQIIGTFIDFIGSINEIDEDTLQLIVVLGAAASAIAIVAGGSLILISTLGFLNIGLVGLTGSATVATGAVVGLGTAAASTTSIIGLATGLGLAGVLFALVSLPILAHANQVRAQAEAYDALGNSADRNSPKLRELADQYERLVGPAIAQKGTRVDIGNYPLPKDALPPGGIDFNAAFRAFDELQNSLELNSKLLTTSMGTKFNPGAFALSEFPGGWEEFNEAKMRSRSLDSSDRPNVNVNIESVVGLDAADISRLLSDELATKLSL